MLEKLTKSVKGLFLMLIGFIILLYSLGIIGKSFILFIVALCLMVAGFVIYKGMDSVKVLLKKIGLKD